MFKLSSILGFLGLAFFTIAQSPHGEDFKMNCAACHSSDSWVISSENWNMGKLVKPVETNETAQIADSSFFNHNETAFALEGEHATTDCRLCHQNLVFTNTNSQCISCHTDMHNMTVGTDCARCHSVDDWLVDNITELHQDEGFPLLGTHAQIACTDCHISDSGLQFNRIGNECANCHREDYMATTMPSHVAAGYSMECLDCHDVNAYEWSAEIEHDFFPLVKGHNIDCALCHSAGVYTGLPTDCFACHQTDFEATTDPNHTAANFTTDCASCHTLDPGWTPADFTDHDNFFPLNGAHQQIDCYSCHNSTFTNTPNTCFGCHQNDFEAATDPNHVAANFPTDCKECHNEVAWEPATFDHNATNFPLTGAHVSVDCASCHANGFAGTPTDCAACHTADYEQTTSPDHQLLGFSTDCVSCHTTSPDWMPATFADHNNYYPLNGAHAQINCLDCHNSTYTNTPTTCVGCHQDDYDSAIDPNHVAAGFPTNCLECHNENAWEPATFDHNATNFPLTGAHTTVNCSSCHANGYSGTPTDCAACHTTDYEQTTSPDHQVLGFSTDCTSCHTTAPDWTPATFDDHNNYYPLNGAHAVIANNCAACHNSTYTNTPTTCFGCHQSDYNNANNPNHSGAGFPTDCTECHNENNWGAVNFNHDSQYFPIYSGKHQGEWDQCVDCHTTPGNFSLFSCIDCHEHDDPTDLADEHDDEPDYEYVSTSCFACHPNGE